MGQWAEKNPEAVKMIRQNGHDIGNHSYSHLRMGALGKDRIRQEIELCNKKLVQLTGSKIELFRAPYGDYSNNTVRIARELGCFTIQWDVDSLDWKPGITKEVIISRIKKKVKPGSIILFHNDTPHTAEILPEIIKLLKNKGYKIIPLTDLIHRENYEIDIQGKQKLK